MTFDEYFAKWRQAFTDRGHVFVLNDDGKPDNFRVDHGFHNGPECARCGWDCCQHCTAIEDIPACTALSTPPADHVLNTEGEKS